MKRLREIDRMSLSGYRTVREGLMGHLFGDSSGRKVSVRGWIRKSHV